MRLLQSQSLLASVHDAMPSSSVVSNIQRQTPGQIDTFGKRALDTMIKERRSHVMGQLWDTSATLHAMACLEDGFKIDSASKSLR